MGKIEKETRDFIASFDPSSLGDKETLQEFERSAQKFDEMIKEGVTTPRGYTLQTVEDSAVVMAFNMAL
ncbi:MAG: hypothetical protein IJK22_04280 [Bacteroidales bacterium]|nr:hypothetical protein [Bacteroidales bacterium]